MNINIEYMVVGDLHMEHVTCPGVTGNKSLGRCFFSELYSILYDQYRPYSMHSAISLTIHTCIHAVHSRVTPFIIVSVSLAYLKEVPRLLGRIALSDCIG